MEKKENEEVGGPEERIGEERAIHVWELYSMKIHNLF